MHSIPADIRARIEQEFGPIDSIQGLSGGDINLAYYLKFTGGDTAFLKHNRSCPKNFFAAEASGLYALAHAECVRVPEVRLIDESFLVLEYMHCTKNDQAQDAALGTALAELHRVTAKAWGFDGDNYIGLNPQKNKWTDRWSKFFIEQRLDVQIRLAEQRWASTEFLTRYKLARDRIENLLQPLDEDPPSLIHGDLWSGNACWTDRGPALIDPAAYFGHREAEIAFTELFSGFSARFYQAYEAAWPLRKDYAARRDAHNLYHIINHASLFGGHYCQMAETMLRQFIIC